MCVFYQLWWVWCGFVQKSDDLLSLGRRTWSSWHRAGNTLWLRITIHLLVSTRGEVKFVILVRGLSCASLLNSFQLILCLPVWEQKWKLSEALCFTYREPGTHCSEQFRESAEHLPCFLRRMCGLSYSPDTGFCSLQLWSYTLRGVCLFWSHLFCLLPALIFVGWSPGYCLLLLKNQSIQYFHMPSLCKILQDPQQVSEETFIS